MDVLQERLGAATVQRDLRSMAVFLAGTAMVHEVEPEEGGGGRDEGFVKVVVVLKVVVLD